jgi:ATP-dependent RNA helicase MSS116
MTPYKFVDQPPASIHPQTLEAITNVMKLERLTKVQHKTLQQSCIASNRNGSVVVNDVLGRARSGTGKTVAFLMPAIHTVLSNTTNIKQSIQVLVISPTRELATQITTQAQQMLTFHQQLSVQSIMGETNMKTDISKFSNKLPTILVATTARMKDHLENTTLKNGTKFGANCLSELKVLVLDEADQLLEMGFHEDIFKIVSYLPPPESRQTLLFSATMSNMKPSYVTVDCIHDYGNDNNDMETNAHVEQTHVILPPGMDRLVVSVLQVMLQAMKQQEYFAELVNVGIRKRNPKHFPEIVEIRSRKSQDNRGYGSTGGECPSSHVASHKATRILCQTCQCGFSQTQSQKIPRNCGNSFAKESRQSQ